MPDDEKLWPEPAPNWPQAKNVWKWCWPFHVYLFTTLSFLVVFRSLYVMIKLKKAHVLKKDHRFFMNLLLLVFGSTRAVLFLSNPYGSDPDVTKTELVICIITFGFGTACITSAFSFVLLIILESTRISLVPSKFQNRGFLLGVCIINILYVITSDIIVAHFPVAKAMILVCQVLLAIWGFMIALGFALAGARLWRNLKASRQTAQFDPGLATESKKVTRLVFLLFSASFCGVVMFSTIFYLAFGDTGVYNEIGLVRNWPWIVVQTLMRTSETLMCLLIFLVALKTRNIKSANNNQVDSYSKS
ncbi:uncharacterized protein LOC111335249 [Stylophora pistillata]|uniref:uncharacterized protein LOC111335249 n=1 Tax=Stylophora pistillata TaxID=50429 RepID=UPI000C047BB7|nr:uncharacterized protein LOC111335249 [Stylophora pistillata]